ncbi:unnamed protein product [Nesidiocoris tenuis]|uniref:SH3 domain-containing protein n=1 Tax=Nesidiocoris tenuis TaxID=355587 RepID=A0A6H5H541_9HEMI|nr:unnamed protein product [Nesidiocoris tenuis]
MYARRSRGHFLRESPKYTFTQNHFLNKCLSVSPRFYKNGHSCPGSQPTDLSFKKGDLIYLRKKVDLNWFKGDINGRVGVFPANYVQGEVITIIRRVDENWAEGKLNNKIGIFPIAFVELNSVAQALVKLSFEYVALYPYKPGNSDELELKRGAIYTVTERCQDGWFKGQHFRSQKTGVFPGNYVAPAK